jgi:hypothetical protein
LIDRILENPDFEASKEALQQHFEPFPEVDEPALRNSWAQIQNVDFLKPLLANTAAI